MPAKSICTPVPKGLPIKFYDTTWFNSRTPGQKTVISDFFNVAFLPNSSASIQGVHHANKILRNRKFTETYWEKVIGPYDISHEITNDDSDETEGELSDGSDVVSSEEESEEEEVEEASKEGEFNLELEKDTEMAHAQDLDFYTVPHHNEWVGW
ncbi:hypothetical protein O181_015530 [Austropuccinia psidii MF-1]|uniref:Uncharacterized protein n=1 Tax=Austropuccinia psidii MF-1 TaxID=1389203 RepID=A0A9Q3C441_9BASI|nr:hypothetical protein [Austropuccinia psidii MF-1]